MYCLEVIRVINAPGVCERFNRKPASWPHPGGVKMAFDGRGAPSYQEKVAQGKQPEKLRKAQ